MQIFEKIRQNAMSSNVPVTRQISTPFIIIQLIIFGLFVGLFVLLDAAEPIFFGLAIYITIAFGLQTLFSNTHKEGIIAVKQKKFEKALLLFEKSYTFFLEHNNIDKYRAITLFSGSKMCYKEMALCNIAFCYSQTGNGLKAKEYYEKVLENYPSNGLASAGLNMINSMNTE